MQFNCFMWLRYFYIFFLSCHSACPGVGHVDAGRGGGGGRRRGRVERGQVADARHAQRHLPAHHHWRRYVLNVNVKVNVIVKVKVNVKVNVKIKVMSVNQN